MGRGRILEYYGSAVGRGARPEPDQKTIQKIFERIRIVRPVTPSAQLEPSGSHPFAGETAREERA
jgi:hypothetical protein